MDNDLHKESDSLRAGLALLASGQTDAATTHFHRAVELNPQSAPAFDGLGICAAAAHQVPQAIELFRRAIALDPTLATAHYHLGKALRQRKLPIDEKSAISAFETALRLDPHLADAHSELALLLGLRGQFDRAEAEFHRALRIDPNHLASLLNLATALNRAGRPVEAVPFILRAAALAPGPDILVRAASAFLSIGDPAQAIEWCQRAIAIDPTHALAHSSLGLALLATGDYHRGWLEYEWRWQTDSFPPAARKFPQPIWDGHEDLHGQPLFVHQEQGLGDQIQFCRYIPALADRGIRVAFECPPSLMPLLKDLRGVSEIVPPGAPIDRFPRRLPIMSLPRCLGTTLDTVPGAIPYLRADPTRRNVFTDALLPHSGRLKIGIVWAGHPSHERDRFRSIRLPTLIRPLAAAASEAVFVSLQKGNSLRATDPPPPGLRWLDLTARLNDFADTAALIDQLDLIIGVDTAVIHLAGAMGKPVWTLLAKACDFRWMLAREDTPWYPTMRLFRQTILGEWPSVIEQVALDLSARARR